MSHTLSLPDPRLTRVFTISIPEAPIRQLNAFLKMHVTLLILGNFENEDILIESANKMCKESSENQAVVWIKEDSLIKKIAENIEVDSEKILAVSFAKMTKDVVYKIKRNPSSSLEKMSPSEMSFAFGAALRENNTTV